MKMMNIILSFFILVIFSNVKAASFQRASSSNPKSIGLISVNQPIVTVTKYSPNYHQILDEINGFLRKQSEDIKCAYEGTNYHWVISNFVITINNSSPYLSKSIPKNKTEELQIGSSYFITYINANINHLFSKYMHKYDFESNYDENLNVLANDLKTLIYDPFDKNFKGGLIKYTNEPENKKLRDSAKKTFYELVHNSEIEIEGYFIKVSKDGNYADLKQNKSLYFNIRLSEKNANFKYELKIPTPNVVKLVYNISGKS